MGYEHLQEQFDLNAKMLLPMSHASSPPWEAPVPTPSKKGDSLWCSLKSSAEYAQDKQQVEPGQDGALRGQVNSHPPTEGLFPLQRWGRVVTN